MKSTYMPFSALALIVISSPLSIAADRAIISEQARVLGELSDGTPSPRKAVVKPLPDYQIHWSQIKHVNGQKFIEAIHDLYAAEEGRLIAAHTERLKNRKTQVLIDAELRKNPPPKPDITINFWERDVVKERQRAEKIKINSMESASQKGGRR